MLDGPERLEARPLRLPRRVERAWPIRPSRRVGKHDPVAHAAKSVDAASVVILNLWPQGDDKSKRLDQDGGYLHLSCRDLVDLGQIVLGGLPATGPTAPEGTPTARQKNPRWVVLATAAVARRAMAH